MRNSSAACNCEGAGAGRNAGLPLWLVGYSAGMAAVWPLARLYYWLRVSSRASAKYRENHRSRLGLDFPPFFQAAPRIWVHALSVGETLSAAPLLAALKRRLPGEELVFSTATESGQRIARDRLGALVDFFLYLPHDFPWATAEIIHRINPTVFLQIETDIWPNLVFGLKRKNIPAFLVNARISPKSFRRMAFFRKIFSSLFRCYEAIFTQSTEDASRFLALGAREGRVHAAGNLKFDAVLAARVSEARLGELRRETGIEPNRKVWIAGSTHQGEEDMLLGVHDHLRRSYPDLLLILAPRQAGRAGEIAALCEARRLSHVMRSSRASAAGKSVLLLDTLGELSSFYALAQLAFIGGSMVPFGGHNPLEPIVYGTPTLWGPHLFNFREMEETLLEFGCAARASSWEELQAVLKERLSDEGLRRGMGDAARRFMSTHSDCSGRIAERVALLSRSNMISSLTPSSGRNDLFLP